MNPANKRVDKIMVFKPLNRLPSAFKYLGDHAPKGEEKVIVLTEDNVGNEIYLRVRHKKGQAVINRRHFWTVGQHKTHLKRREQSLTIIQS